MGSVYVYVYYIGDRVQFIMYHDITRVTSTRHMNFYHVLPEYLAYWLRVEKEPRWRGQREGTGHEALRDRE